MGFGNLIEFSFVGLVALIGGTTGGGAFGMLIAQAVQDAPNWVGLLAGPLGSIVGMVVAITWFAKYTDKLQTKHDNQQALFTELLKSTTIALTVSSGSVSEAKLAIQRNDTTLEEVLEHLQRLNSPRP